VVGHNDVTRESQPPKADVSGDGSERPSLVEAAVYVPIGLAAIAREVAEKLLNESVERGQEEVNKIRTALENEFEIARSVGRARVHKAVREAAERLEYPPLSVVAEAGRAVLNEVLRAWGRVTENIPGMPVQPSDGGAASPAEDRPEADRAASLVHLHAAQRTAAARVLKARFGRGDGGADSAGSGEQPESGRGGGSAEGRGTDAENTPVSLEGGEVIEVDFETETTRRDAQEEAVDSDGMQVPLEDYDSLSASQVIARLGGLEPEELERLLDYEKGHRNRAAILKAIENRLRSGTAPDVTGADAEKNAGGGSDQ